MPLPCGRRTRATADAHTLTWFRLCYHTTLPHCLRLTPPLPLVDAGFTFTGGLRGYLPAQRRLPTRFVAIRWTTFQLHSCRHTPTTTHTADLRVYIRSTSPTSTPYHLGSYWAPRRLFVCCHVSYTAFWFISIGRFTPRYVVPFTTSAY